jgi:hypothetical protein
VRWEANHIHNERLQAQSQTRQAWSATQAVLGARGEKSPSDPESSGGGVEEEDEDDEDGEVTPPPHSPLPKDLPSLGDLFSQQAGISIGVRQPKRPRTGTGASSSPPLLSSLTLVSSDLYEVSAVLLVMGIAHLRALL